MSFVRAFGDRIHSAQLSDNRGRVDEHMTIGEGTIDFARVLGALGRIGFAGPLIIELFDVPKKLVSHRRLLALLAERAGRRRPGGQGAAVSPRDAAPGAHGRVGARRRRDAPPSQNKEAEQCTAPRR